MKWFLKMVEVLKAISVHHGKSCPLFVKKALIESEKAEIFVFQSKAIESEWFSSPFRSDAPAPPFPVFFIEIIDKSIFSVPTEKSTTSVLGILVIEKSPCRYEYCMLVHDFVSSVGSERYTCVELTDKSPEMKEMVFLVNYYIDTIHKGSAGIETVNIKVKLTTGRNKKIRKIRRVIHIRSKKERENVKPYKSGQHIDWSHSWLVRGHWRTIKGIGKDRAGNYCLSGKTFVLPYKKGEGDVIKKVRVVN